MPTAVDPYTGTTVPTQRDTAQILLLKLVALFQGFVSPTPGGTGTAALATQGALVKANIVGMTANQSVTIPAGAKGWAFVLQTGTGTIGGAAVGAGFTDSDQNTLTAGLTVTTGATSTAYVRYNT